MSKKWCILKPSISTFRDALSVIGDMRVGQVRSPKASSAERVRPDASPASWAAFWRIRAQHQVKTGPRSEFTIRAQQRKTREKEQSGRPGFAYFAEISTFATLGPGTPAGVLTSQVCISWLLKSCRGEVDARGCRIGLVSLTSASGHF